MTMNRFMVLLCAAAAIAPCLGVRHVRIASPLQSLTIWDAEAKAEKTSPRDKFLPKFKAGLEAEQKTRKQLAEKRSKQLQVDATAKDWAKKAADADRRQRNAEERLVEKAWDKAVSKMDASEKDVAFVSKNKSKGAYQFVGVIHPPSQKKAISWYARKKPEGAKWSVRLVHVNRAAIIKDLFNRGKVDIFAKYENTGKRNEETNLPIVNSKYEVKERSWKNAWNFSPKHFFTDSSGMYWRERRLRPGLYTDGNSVYESSYRYRDGRNGMHRLSNFQQLLKSKSIDETQKETIVRRLKEDTPDLVLEE